MNGPGLSQHPGLVGGGGAGGGGGVVDGLRRGANLPDQSTIVNPGSDQMSTAVLPVLTAARTLGLGIAGRPRPGLEFVVVRTSLSGFTYEVFDTGPDGTGSTELFTFPVSPLVPMAALFRFDGDNWNFVDWWYVQGGTYAPPTSPTFLAPTLWLRADLQLTQVAGKGSAWVDQATPGRTYVQGNPALRPTFSAAALAGLPGLRFGPTLLMTAPTAPWTAGAQRWMWAVIRTGLGAGGVLFGTRSAVVSWGLMAQSSGGNFQVYSDFAANVSKTVPTLTPAAGGHLVEIYTSVGATPIIIFDGIAQMLAGDGFGNVTGNDTGGTAQSQVGNYFGGDAGFDNTICELIGGAGTLSAAQQFAGRAYVANRYGLVI